MGSGERARFDICRRLSQARIMLPLGLYLMGDAPEAISTRHGNYRHWFEALAERSEARLTVADGRVGENIELGEVAAVIISGSPESLTDRQPWMNDGFELVESCRTRGRPVLGVCFGHQLLGAYAGGEVVRNPLGWEFGTREIAVTDRSDPIFAGCEAHLEVNQAHQDILARESLPSAVRILAGNRRADVQALALGDWARGVQFHPEFTGEVTAAYLVHKRAVLEGDASEHGPERHPDRLAARNCPQAARVFGNFIEHFARRA
ncbi:MAG: gamma-glutamyl-gamma-aminobutyrate hydrolase family protein [Deltaproteobacteria bacterium]|nr:gamma-glutamyl-gamma-aminobutyrate hydrolase family protein [Deltaproteobacteria bacterium]